MKLNQVKALVTGGVSGLGLAVTRHIIANGGKAVMLDVNDEAGAAAEAELGTKYIRTNVTSEENVIAAVDQAAEINGECSLHMLSTLIASKNAQISRVAAQH